MMWRNKKGMPLTHAALEGRQTLRTSTSRNDTPKRECVQSSCASSEFKFRGHPGWRFPRQSPKSETLIVRSALLGPNQYSSQILFARTVHPTTSGASESDVWSRLQVKTWGAAGSPRNATSPASGPCARFRTTPQKAHHKVSQH